MWKQLLISHISYNLKQEIASIVSTRWHHWLESGHHQHGVHMSLD